MENLFSEGLKKFKENNFEDAESLFLQCLSEYAKEGEPNFYPWASGSLDYLALHIYPKKVIDKGRTTRFFELMSEVDMNASFGFAKALVNGTVGDKYPKEEVFKQLSKGIETLEPSVMYLLHSFFHHGSYVDKNIEFAVYLLWFCIELNYQTNEAKENLSKIFEDNENSSFRSILDQDFETNEDKVYEILGNTLPSNEIKINKSQRHQKVIQLFKEIDFKRIKIEPAEVKQSQSVYPSLDHKDLDEAFMAGAYPIVFKCNPKYSKDDLPNNTPFISLVDILENKYIIRDTDNWEDKGNDKPIIVQYGELWNIVDDGWRLD
jgi:hypothetical protein